jgi:hypothetical protein
MAFFAHQCPACMSKDEMIAYLKQDIERRNAAWESERGEYKRTVDRLLQEKHIAPIGQGVQTTAPQTSPVDMLKIFEEISEEKGV